MITQMENEVSYKDLLKRRKDIEEKLFFVEGLDYALCIEQLKNTNALLRDFENQMKHEKL